MAKPTPKPGKKKAAPTERPLNTGSTLPPFLKGPAAKKGGRPVPKKGAPRGK